MTRRIFSREFKQEAVELVTKRTKMGTGDGRFSMRSACELPAEIRTLT